MDREEIIRMAKEAEIAEFFFTNLHEGVVQQMERFAALVAEHERNACAQVVEAIDRNGAWVTKAEAAAAIKARSKQ
jgi:hypothetical protein